MQYCVWEKLMKITWKICDVGGGGDDDGDREREREGVSENI